MPRLSVLRLCAAGLLLAGQATAIQNLHVLKRHFTEQVRLSAGRDDDDGTDRLAHIKAFNLSVPIDHFHNDSSYEPHSDGTFPLRYYLDTSNYKPGGPVIVLASGETGIEARLPFMQHGILSILTRATGGVGVILEHRYYGTSFPVPNLETDNMRFLTTDQALADTAYFARHVKFPGLGDDDDDDDDDEEQPDLTAPNAPWLIYGGSYAGAFAAFARVLYPDVFWGAISSSGVTQAIDDYWEYYTAARDWRGGDCGRATQQVTTVVDSVLFGGNRTAVAELKGFFGMRDVESDYDFATALSFGVTGLQSTNWDPAQDSSLFGRYCASVTAKIPLYSSVEHIRPAVEGVVSRAGVDAGFHPNQMLNYVAFIRFLAKEICGKRAIPDCVALPPVDTGLSHPDFRSWMYQVCTQWGYFQTGSGTPASQAAMVSRAITLEASSAVCQQQFNITARPDVARINRHGGFNISYPRLAIVDGESDPWREATPHAAAAPARGSTTARPFILIEQGVHHWDEYGVPDDERGQGLPPTSVAAVQEAMVEFVRAWLKEWREEQGL